MNMSDLFSLIRKLITLNWAKLLQNMLQPKFLQTTLTDALFRPSEKAYGSFNKERLTSLCLGSTLCLIAVQCNYTNYFYI